MSDPAISPPERDVADSVGSAVLLAFAGGAIDAFMYLNHGHTFAAAQTGNAVLCGVALLEHDHTAILRHLLPILAFAAGIYLAEVLNVRVRRHSISLGLALEIAGLVVCSWLPGSFPELAYVPVISFLAAYQVTTFRNVGPFAYNSTFITGNLRTAVVGLFRVTQPEHHREGVRQSASLFAIIGCFVAGAMISAELAGRMNNHTLWIPAAVLAIVLVRTLRAI